jgi:L-alanine-DL-glutamate epimerase-like enolase superfamily enzyme
MKITNVEAFSLTAPLKEPWKIAKVVIREMTCTLVKISTNAGITGIGESLARLGPEATRAIVDKILKPILIGADPFDVEILWEQMFSALRTRGHHKGFMIEAISGVDIALWDIIGKATNLPVYKLLGGKAREKVEAYASSLLFKETDVLVKEAVELVEEGYRSIKLKIGQGIQKDAHNVKAIREAIGDGINLMVDANSGFDAHNAIALGKELERHHVFWMEEPVPPDDLCGYQKVSRALTIPVAAGESEFTRYGFRDLITQGNIAIVQPDVARAGGISEVKKIAVLASSYNLPYCPHTGASGAVCVAASIQLSAAIPNFLIFEYMYPPNPLREDILKEPLLEVHNGYIQVPDKPGLGIELDEGKVAEYMSR